MFFQECEHLANEYPNLKEIIDKIDEILHSSGPSSIFRPDEFASYLQERLSQISGIFNNLTEKGLLREETNIECPKCSNLMDPKEYEKALADQDTFECTQCQCDLIQQSPEMVKVYRLNPDKIRNPNHKEKKEDPLDSLQISAQFHQDLPPVILKDPFRNTHLLRYYSRDPELLKIKPFRGKRVLFVLHFLKDLIPFVKAAENLGLDIKNAYFFYKDYPYPQRDAIKKWLEEQGAVVRPRSYITQYLEQLATTSLDRIGEVLIIEDGGFIAPAIHKQYPTLIPYVKGAVEQTTRGIRNAEKIEKLQFPIIPVATSELKSDFEPQYIAKAVVKNIERMLPNITLNGKTAALFGCGAIGKSIAKWLRENGVNVTIFEPSSKNKIWAQQNGFNLVDSPGEASNSKNFVIGASGRQSINAQVIASVSHGTYLISASSELYEIDMEELARQTRNREILRNDDGEEIGITFILPPTDRHIYVLANGYPINFWGFESMPEEASDLILSLILLSSAEVALGSYPTPEINSDAVNQIAKKYKVTDKFLEFHKQG